MNAAQEIMAKLMIDTFVNSNPDTQLELHETLVDYYVCGSSNEELYEDFIYLHQAGKKKGDEDAKT